VWFVLPFCLAVEQGRTHGDAAFTTSAGIFKISRANFVWDRAMAAIFSCDDFRTLVDSKYMLIFGDSSK